MIQWSLRLENWPIAALIASLAMLAAAHGFERLGGMAPCALCLHQREAYWIAAGVALVGIAISRFRPGQAAALKAINALLVVAFASGATIAAFHVGVELKWWPGLPSCAGQALDADTDLLGALQGPLQGGRCDEIPWAMFGISMAGWNILVALGLAALSLVTVLRAGDFGSGLGETDSGGLGQD